MRIKRSGFTLVEILIVVVILGILAAIVIPQFTDASTQAKNSSLRADLQTVRSQIELYKVQHGGDLPGNEIAADTTFVEAMIGTTNAAGSKAGSNFGPYLQAIPANPYDADLNNDITENGVLGDASAAWEFNTTTGAFNADDDADAAHKDW